MNFKVIKLVFSFSPAILLFNYKNSLTTNNSMLKFEFGFDFS